MHKYYIEALSVKKDGYIVSCGNIVIGIYWNYKLICGKRFLAE